MAKVERTITLLGPESAQGDVQGMVGLAQERTAPFGRKRCWEIVSCSLQDCAICAALQRPDIPCWVARQIAGQPLPEGCGICPVRALY